METLDNTLIVTPRSRLRELVNRIEELKRVDEKIVIDMTSFDTADPANIGAIQVFELGLFSDYVCKKLIPYETLATNQLSIEVIYPHRNSNPKLEDFTNFLQRAISILANNLVCHSGVNFGEGDGLLVLQADRDFEDEILTRYRIILAVGDLGIGLPLGLERSHGENLRSDLEALRSYVQKPTMSKFISDLTNKWNGHIQIHSREAMISLGKGGYSFIEGRYPRIPGLQIISLIEMKVDENE